jgi:hypothetical protein
MYSTNKTDSHDIIETLLKVVFKRGREFVEMKDLIVPVSAKNNQILEFFSMFWF